MKNKYYIIYETIHGMGIKKFESTYDVKEFCGKILNKEKEGTILHILYGKELKAELVEKIPSIILYEKKD